MHAEHLMFVVHGIVVNVLDLVESKYASVCSPQKLHPVQGKAVKGDPVSISKVWCTDGVPTQISR